MIENNKNTEDENSVESTVETTENTELTTAEVEQESDLAVEASQSEQNGTVDENSSDTDSDENKAEEGSVQADTKRKFLISKAEGPVAGFFDWIQYLLFAIAIVVVCLTFIFRLVDVDGSSMYDTLSSGDKVIVTNLFYKPQNGDIVVISHGASYNHPIIKRVIATEGQTVKVDYENDRIIVDGIVLEESYIDDSTYGGNIGDNVIPEVVPEGQIFVMGDNRKVSMDSRSTEIGLIDVDNVIGKAQIVAFPLNNFGYLY